MYSRVIKKEKKKVAKRLPFMLQNLIATEHTIDSSKCIDVDLPNYWTNWATTIAEKTKPREALIL